MANKQTRSLAKKGLSVKFNHGVDFSKERKHHGNGDPGWWPELTKVERPKFKGQCVDSSFANREKTGNKRTKAWQGHGNPHGREILAVAPGNF